MNSPDAKSNKYINSGDLYKLSLLEYQNIKTFLKNITF